MKRATEHTLDEGLRQGARRRLVGWLAAAIFAAASLGSSVLAEDWETPQTRLRPIGAPSAVDAFPRSSNPRSGDFPQSAPTAQPVAAPSGWVRQAAMMQASQPLSMPMPALPPEGGATSGSSALPAPLSASPGLGPIGPAPAGINNTPLPRPAVSPLPQAAATPYTAPGFGQAAHPQSPAPQPYASMPAGTLARASDYAPLAQPQLEQTFATLGNCRNISAPSGYRSDRILTCGPPASYVTTVGASAPPPSYLPPPAQLGPPVTLPPMVAAPGATPLATTQTVLPGSAGHRPLISFGQENYPVQIGQGIFGQPTAYVPGQTVRNAIRYFTW